MSKPLEICILGAGPAGLLLAKYLTNNLEPSVARVQVYEREASANARTQGGTLDLHAESGLLAIEKVGLTKELEEKLRPEGEQTRIFDKTGKLWLDTGVEDGSTRPPEQRRPEIDRKELRDLMLNSLPPNTITWDRQVKSCELVMKNGNSQYQVNFTSTPAVVSDLLFDCTGARSPVRALLTDIQPIYSGITMYDITLSTELINGRPQHAELVGQGTAFCISDRKALVAQRNSTSIRVYAGFEAPEDYLDQHPLPPGREESREFIATLYKDWFDAGKNLILEADGDIVARKLMTIPPGKFEWTRSDDALGLVTLLGDAAHVMPPNGEGVNIALLDALELGQGIVAALQNSPEDRNALAQAIKIYEKSMWARANLSEEEGRPVNDMLYKAESPQPILDFFSQFGPPSPTGEQ